MENNKKPMSKLSKITLVVIAAIALIAILLLIVFSGSGEVTVNIESSLKEMISSSDLRTANYTYNSIAEAKDGDETKYYVWYQGEVTAGLNFEDVDIVRDGTVIRIIVPDVQILEVLVKPEMRFMFVKDKYDEEGTFIEATEVCKKDLMDKAKQNTTLLETARESAMDILKALVKPFESQLAEGETFEIVIGNEKEAG